ncbi:sulfate permease [Flammeovirga sp. SubArs3]|uniref:SulP family inorganic anion transporter n=1 Tax=Flammeovirga sp. SubArs3 TaxID=2995316 RepID=UPI00248CB73A|nr:sulfate permease [Flammeovirga sp. SubArs3]
MKNPITALSLLRNYKVSNISGDAAAGFATGIMLIPQGMAYAVIAGLPVQYGLYASLIAPICYFLFGTTQKLVVGPAALDSMLLASGIASLGVVMSSEEYVANVMVVVFFAGILQVIAGLLKFGFIANFFSQPLLKGFTTAAALLIAFSQVTHLFGLEKVETSYFHQELYYMISKASHMHFPTLIVGFGTLLVIFLAKKVNLQKISTPLIVVISILLSMYMDFEGMGVGVVGNIPSGLPQLILPSFEQVNLKELLPISVIVAIIGFTVSNSIIKSVEEGNSKININREFIALGLSNSIGTLFGGYQASSSFSRTAINQEAGAKTRASNIISSVMIAIVLLFFTDIFYYLPKAVLAAVIIAATPSLFSFSYFKEIYFLRKREFVVCILTFILTIEFGVIVGLSSGVIASLGVFMYQTLKPHLAVLGKIEDTRIYKNILRFDGAKEENHIIIFRVDAPLYFSNIRYVLDEMKRELSKRTDIHAIVIKSESINSIDITALNELKQFIHQQKRKGIELYMCSVVGPVRDLLYKGEVVEQMGGNQLFLYLNDVIKYIKDKEAYNFKNKKIANQSSKE